MYFFFQAEDGIRDIGVTGVQTCALPIFTDGKGRTAGFVAVVTDVAKAWVTREVITARSIMDCVVSGASSVDSMAIVTDAKARFEGLTYAVRQRTFFPSSVYRMAIYDKSNRLLEEHFLIPIVKSEDKNAVMRYELYDEGSEKPLETMTFDPRKGLERDVVRYYRERYPRLKSVLLRMDVNVNSGL